MRTLGRGNPGSSHLRELDSVPPANSLCHVRRHVCSSHGLGVDVFGVRYSAHRRGHSPHTQFRPPPRALQLVGKSSGPWDWMVPTRSFTHSGTAGQRPPSPGPALRDGLRGRGATRGSLLGGLGILARRSPVFGEWSPTGGGAEQDAGATRASPLRPAAPLGPASLLGVGGTFASPAVPCEAPARAGAAPCGPGDDDDATHARHRPRKASGAVWRFGPARSAPWYLLARETGVAQWKPSHPCCPFKFKIFRCVGRRGRANGERRGAAVTEGEAGVPSAPGATPLPACGRAASARGEPCVHTGCTPRAHRVHTACTRRAHRAHTARTLRPGGGVDRSICSQTPCPRERSRDASRGGRCRGRETGEAEGMVVIYL